MGKPKQLLPVKGRPMLEKVLEGLSRTMVDHVIVVLGSHGLEIRKRVKFRGETIVLNPDYSRGMSSSLKVGLTKVRRSDRAVFIVLADQPLISPGTIDRMAEAYLASGTPIVVPVYRGVRGNPVLFDRRLFPAIMKVSGDSGAKPVVMENQTMVLEVPVEDEGVVSDVDTQSEYQSVILDGVRRRPGRARPVRD